MRKLACILAAAALALSVSPALGDIDWNSVPIIPHSTYQAVYSDGGSAYVGGFPVRLVGVALNNTEDWLDPTAAYSPTYVPWSMGGQAELIIQAVALDDFGGTFAWMGQNYGNTWVADPDYNQTDAQWTAELGRLGFYGGDGVTDPVRAGDLVEVRARIGLHYQGKMNVNEAHNPSPLYDFEVIILQRDYGLPTPTDLPLNLVKDAADGHLFDPTRASGGERYQGTLVDLKNVRVLSGTWGPGQTITVQDTSDRRLQVRMGINSDFAATDAPPGFFNAVGVFTQASTSGKDGYHLLALDPGGIIRHGDADRDYRVSIHDFNVVLQNYSGFAGTGLAWSQGNFNEAENGSVDIHDFNATIANFTGNTPYWSGGDLLPTGELLVLGGPTPTGGPGPVAGQVQLIVDVLTGRLTLLGNSAQVNNWDIYSPSGSLLPDLGGEASPWAGYLINNQWEVAAYTGIGSFVNVDGELVLGAAFQVGGTLDLQFLYAGTDGNVAAGQVAAVPEPGTLALLAVGALAVVARRRRA